MMTSPAPVVDSYFSHARRDIEPLLPAKAERILEIGCSSGATLGWLRDRWPDAMMLGIDGHAPLEPLIRARAGHALIHDLEQPLPEIGRFDLILALDILEHLRHPEAVLSALTQRLLPGGTCLVSVPNIASYQILAPLLFRRHFRYQDAGPMDRTHLRWFTEDSALALMRDAGLGVVDGVITGFSGGRRRLFDWASLGLFRHYLTVQYILKGKAGPDRAFRWRRDWPRL